MRERDDRREPPASRDGGCSFILWSRADMPAGLWFSLPGTSRRYGECEGELRGVAMLGAEAILVL